MGHISSKGVPIAHWLKRVVNWLKKKVRRRLHAHKWLQEVYKQSEASFHPSADFEEVDPEIGRGLRPRAKVIAFYLPQFHEFEENNSNWGKGFTEWTNLSRNIPRFPGHIAPRVPRDLGFYNLMQGEIQIAQAEMARNAGVYGFCYYYYRFNGRGFMDGPIERMLKDPRVDFPFCIMWCNETWTRSWIGRERSVIAKQEYSDLLDVDLVDDAARFFSDSRYIKFDNRPFFIVYRPSFIPAAAAKFDRLRRLFEDRHGVRPILAMAQTDAAVDPTEFRLDAAVEFSANKYNNQLKKATQRSDVFDTGYGSDAIYDYDHLIKLSLDEPIPAYPLARSVMPDWDKNPRRPGRAHVIHGSTPAKFQKWTNALLDIPDSPKFFGDRVLFVNAWNEWAESAYLEPDTHRGGAYLNSLARAVFR